jgi:hypothetical protein
MGDAGLVLQQVHDGDPRTQGQVRLGMRCEGEQPPSLGQPKAADRVGDVRSARPAVRRRFAMTATSIPTRCAGDPHHRRVYRSI